MWFHFPGDTDILADTKLSSIWDLLEDVEKLVEELLLEVLSCRACVRYMDPGELFTSRRDPP